MGDRDCGAIVARDLQHRQQLLRAGLVGHDRLITARRWAAAGYWGGGGTRALPSSQPITRPEKT